MYILLLKCVFAKFTINNIFCVHMLHTSVRALAKHGEDALSLLGCYKMLSFLGTVSVFFPYSLG